ncbi:unnamed protein product [Clavelina lepadiformis]|uniref:Uncharacterized protein n=1 Tax=Clavelina lepadiformis TaxID=159417 RepID=A0ABP0FZ98_CLALP
MDHHHPHSDLGQLILSLTKQLGVGSVGTPILLIDEISDKSTRPTSSPDCNYAAHKSIHGSISNYITRCEFVLQQKGPDYLHGIVFRFPNLRRPTIRNPTNLNQLRNIQSGPILLNGHRKDAPEIIDPREEVRYLVGKVDKEMSSSELVEQAKLMGFDERMIKNAFKT